MQAQKISKFMMTLSQRICPIKVENIPNVVDFNEKKLFMRKNALKKFGATTLSTTALDIKTLSIAIKNKIHKRFTLCNYTQYQVQLC
jgi:hypothetical protein